MLAVAVQPVRNAVVGKRGSTSACANAAGLMATAGFPAAVGGSPDQAVNENTAEIDKYKETSRGGLAVNVIEC
jgi:L-serine deaminase